MSISTTPAAIAEWFNCALTDRAQYSMAGDGGVGSVGDRGVGGCMLYTKYTGNMSS